MKGNKTRWAWLSWRKIEQGTDERRRGAQVDSRSQAFRRPYHWIL